MSSTRTGANSSARPTGSGPIDGWQHDLWRVVFTVRHVSIVALALSAALVPSIGPNRLWIAAAVLTVVLPWNLAVHRWTNRHRSVPAVMPIATQLFGAAFIGLAPTTYVPALLIMVADIGVATAILGRRLAAIALAIGTVAVTAATLALATYDPLLGTVGYVIAAGSLIIAVGALFDGEREVRDRHLSLLGDVDAIVWEAVPDPCRYTFVSERAEEILGFPVAHWSEPDFWKNQIHPADLDRVLEEDGGAMDEGRDHELEYRMIAADGRVVHLRDLVTVITDAAGTAVGLRGVMVDITAQRQAEERVRQYADLVERIQMALLIARLVDPEDANTLEIVAANPTASSFARDWEGDIVGHRLVDVFPGIGPIGLHETLAKVIRTGQPFDLDDFAREQGTARELHFSVHAFPLGPDLVGVSLDDVTGPSMAAQALRRQATHDGLTGLPNRVLLNDRLRQAVREAARTRTNIALLVMDLDQFKEINDALGHHAGDRLLVALSRRLEDVLRGADTIARLGGDEFAFLLTTDANRAGAVTVARKLERALEQPFDIEGLSLQTNASVGIALFPDHATDPESLIQRADVAMYMAKRSAHSFAVYAAEQDHSSVRRVTLIGELRRAVELEELVLFHQPSIDVATGAIVGTEALVRWQHPIHGLMSPSEFIDLAEVSGIIQPLTRWAIRTAVLHAMAWPQLENRPLGVSVNISVRNLYDPDLIAWTEHLLAETRFAPELLTLEITESEVMDDPFLAVEMLGQLRKLGIHTSIDDFGTGQSSLSYLKHLPIDEMKIDCSFIAGLTASHADETIVRAVIDLGHNLGLLVVAEGVENEETLRRLNELGCDRAQGFHLSPPVQAADLPALLAAPIRT